jgi:hypothetical protein
MSSAYKYSTAPKAYNLTAVVQDIMNDNDIHSSHITIAAWMITPWAVAVSCAVLVDRSWSVQ